VVRSRFPRRTELGVRLRRSERVPDLVLGARTNVIRQQLREWLWASTGLLCQHTQQAVSNHLIFPRSDVAARPTHRAFIVWPGFLDPSAADAIAAMPQNGSSVPTTGVSSCSGVAELKLQCFLPGWLRVLVDSGRLSYLEYSNCLIRPDSGHLRGM